MALEPERNKKIMLNKVFRNKIIILLGLNLIVRAIGCSYILTASSLVCRITIISCESPVNNGIKAHLRGNITVARTYRTNVD